VAVVMEATAAAAAAAAGSSLLLEMIFLLPSPARLAEEILFGLALEKRTRNATRKKSSVRHDRDARRYKLFEAGERVCFCFLFLFAPDLLSFFPFVYVLVSFCI
jgi:hypothetical protein